MSEKDTTVRSRELGAELRYVLRRSGLNGKDVARLLGWAESFVSRLLGGKVPVRERDLAAFLGVCRVERPDRDRLLDLRALAHTPGWLQRYGTRLPKQVRTMAYLEEEAVAISSFETLLVPGLLQTEDYTRMLFVLQRGLPPEEIAEHVEVRMQRRTLLERTPRLKFVFYIEEFVLHRMVGDAAVMSEQLHHLLSLSVRTYVTIRVIPASIGVHTGLAGPFTLLDTPNGAAVYLESETSCLFLEEAEEIAAYHRILTGFAESALDEEQSRRLITDLAVTLYPPMEEPDEIQRSDLANQ